MSSVNSHNFRNLPSGPGFLRLVVELRATRAAASDVSAPERSGCVSGS
jgi:hypothetical protein